MGSRETFEVLRDPVFLALAHEAVADYLDRDQLASRPLPAGLTFDETWELLGVVRRLSGTPFPIRTPEGHELWYGLTQEALRCVGFIRRHCRFDSHLSRLLQTRHGHRFLVRSRISEAIATCRLDGVVIDTPRATRILQGGHAPRTPAERLVVNSYQMLKELDALASEPFTPDLVRSLYERLTHGVDLADLPRGPRLSILPSTAGPCEPDVLGAICDYANGTSGDPHEPAVIRGYMIKSVTAMRHPLPDLNETVARHLLRLSAVKRQYPVLGYLPTSLITVRWFEGALEPGVMRFATLPASETPLGSVDWTREILTHLQLTTAAVSELLGWVEAADEQDAALEAARDLNFRQRAVLARALADPGAEFRIREHQTSNRVVYQTARSDLLELEARGYLRRIVRGKAFVFAASEDLRERLAAAR